jgi:DNA topoisomerase-1
VQHDGKYASLSAPEEVFEVGINRAVSLLAEKAANRSPRGASVIKELGDHPDLGGKVQVLSGRYGPYVRHGRINATIPKDIAPEETTLARAVELIAARSAKGPAMKGSARKPAKASKTPAKKSPRKASKSDKQTVEETAG